MSNPQIESIIMYINVESWDEVQEMEIKGSEFTVKMLELFEKEDNWTPSVKLIINKI